MNLTFPHDYQIIAGAGDVRPTVVGGQAVNLWAITFLDGSTTDNLCTKYGSGDMDVLNGPRVLEYLKSLEPQWQVTKTPLWAFGDGRAAVAKGLSADKRPLLVEVIRDVHGLDQGEIITTDIEYAGTTYRVLDLISLLKAKACNVRDFEQDGTPPRHDRTHLRLIAQCVPHYIREIHARALENPDLQRETANAVTRLFAIITDKQVAPVLIGEGIDRSALVPTELADSPIERIRNAYKHRMAGLLPATAVSKPAGDMPAVPDESRPQRPPGRTAG